MNKSCVAAYLGGWPDGRGLSGRMRVERVAGSPWNRWPDAHGMGGRMAVESAKFQQDFAERTDALGDDPVVLDTIRLQQGNESWGLQHIELRHGAEIRDAGFADVPAFVADIAQHIDQVWKPAATRQLVALHKVGNNRMMFVELQPGKDEAGDFYTVNTAFTSRKAEKKGWKLLWEARAQASGESGNRPSFAVSPPVAGGEVTNPSSQSNDSIARPQPEAEAGDKAAIPISIANIKAGDRFQSVKYGNTAPTGGVIEKVGPANITFGGQYMGNPISGVKLPRAALVGGKIVRDGVVYDVVATDATPEPAITHASMP